jgi:hypothetical protein
MRIAIMQPYFLPYAGYFRLFHETDLFVIYDCVQFIRRGWIHRNRFSNANGELSWLTLPLVKAPQEALITELAFTDDATTRMQEQQNKFPLFKQASFLDSDYREAILQFTQHPVAYITQLLQLSCQSLQLPFNITYSSQLNIPADVKGQDRIIAIAKHFKADVYINPPGGRDLYDANAFKHHDIELQFLPEYVGSYESILPRLLNENVETLRNEISTQGIG